MTEIIAFIFARGGSQGLENKNILDFNGKPLIAWTIEQARNHPRISRVIVSTDSKNIATISKTYGAEVPFLRPSELASDTSPELHSWKHAVKFLEDSEGTLPEIFLSLPCTAPLRTDEDIDANINCLIESKGDLAISVSPSARSPHFNVVEVARNGSVKAAIQSEVKYTRRQDAPTTYDITTVAYSCRPSYVIETDNLMGGNVFANVVNRINAIDIDDQMDFEIAEFLFRKKYNLK